MREKDTASDSEGRTRKTRQDNGSILAAACWRYDTPRTAEENGGACTPYSAGTRGDRFAPGLSYFVETNISKMAAAP